jgi:undecaprenyl-diphosphatase
MNQNLFLAINGLVGKSNFLDVLGVFFADKLIYIFALGIALMWFNKSLRYYVYLAFGSAFVSRILIVETIKRLVNHPRPYEVVTNVHQLLVDHQKGMSFPSGHTVIFFAFAFSFVGTKYFWPLLVLAVLGSVARIFVGVHFPADIIVSIIIAGITVWGMRSLFKKPILS